MATAQWCHFVSFVMNISGTKVEEHRFNVSRDILYSVFYPFSCKPPDVLTFLICIIQILQYLLNEKMPFFFILKNLSNKQQLERFSFECRKVIGFGLLRYTIGLKNSCQFFIQSEVKPKPIVTHSHAFSCALRQLPVITSSFDWFTVLCVFFVIG